MKHKISIVEKDSIACELGILPGDFLLSVDEKKVIDVLDYRFCIQSESLIVEIEKQSGEVWELDIEKEFDEDLGLVFELPLMSEIKLCKNNCIFCFVDQEPKGLRKTLYVKDDDWRLSFLHGNFVTLTNVSESEAIRIAGLHLSPLYVSVHAADESVRRKMMNFSGEDKLFRYLHMFGNSGIKMHFQIVLCPGINDGDVLDSTIKKLKEIEGFASVAIVPVGLTKHREGLHPIDHFDHSFGSKTYRSVLDLLIPRQSRPTLSIDPTFFSDEWHLKNGDFSKLPTYEKYGDFPQLANGVGLVRLFEHEFKSELENIKKLINAPKRIDPYKNYRIALRNETTPKVKSIYIVTGTLAESFMWHLAFKFDIYFENLLITVIPIRNNFYGESITVSGLLTGGDIINQLSNKCDCDVLFVPQSSFRYSTEEMIDGTTRTQLEENLNVRVRIGSQDGGDFARQLYEEMLC